MQRKITSGLHWALWSTCAVILMMPHNIQVDGRAMQVLEDIETQPNWVSQWWEMERKEPGSAQASSPEFNWTDEHDIDRSKRNFVRLGKRQRFARLGRL
ncbi:unnamed protein product [Dicrocoelium dendriticum]|nr:unnamed protein product [Dicrocoelium dendriticum]